MLITRSDGIGSVVIFLIKFVTNFNTILNNSGKIFLLYLLFCLFVQMHCTRSKVFEQNQAATHSTPKDSILFLFLNISKESPNQKIVISLQQHTLIPGTLKSDNEQATSTDHKLWIECWAGHKKVREFAIEHPLYKEYEYSSGNEFRRKTIETDADQFFIRTSWNNLLTECKIFEMLGSKKSQLLLSINLNKLK